MRRKPKQQPTLRPRRAPTEAELGRVEAERRLAEVRAETPKWEALSVRIRSAIARNNLAEAIERSFMGDRR